MSIVNNETSPSSTTKCNGIHNMPSLDADYGVDEVEGHVDFAWSRENKLCRY